MIAPWFLRAQLLYAALEKAAAELRAPIDRIEVTPRKVLFWAKTKARFFRRTKRLAISYRYTASSSPYPGSLPRLLLNGEETPTFNAVPRTDRKALPPWDERRELLNAAICKATSALQEPIDHVAVTADKVRLWAGSKELAIAYQYADTFGGHSAPRGFLLDGEDYWECFTA